MNISNTDGIAVAVHPGVVHIGLQKHLFKKWWRRTLAILFYPIIWLALKSKAQGAQSIIYCVLE